MIFSRSVLRPLIATLLLSMLAAAPADSSAQTIQWSRSTAPRIGPNTATSIILYVGDGMGANHRLAAQWLAVGQEGALTMDELPMKATIDTASANSSVTDSAAAATAMATGVRTDNGVIGLDPDGQVLKTILEQSSARGKAVGLVTTTQLSHATPAGFAAHVSHRSMMTEIAAQLLEAEVDLLLGGGEDEFLPADTIGCHPEPGERTDGRDLVAEALAAGYVLVCDASELAALDPATTGKVLGLFADEGMLRPYSPTLAEMTNHAIERLATDPDGFFLLVEGGQIDWASHDNDASNTIEDVIGLDQAVAVGLEHATAETSILVLVVADHETGGMELSPISSGNPDEDGPFYMPDGTPFYVNWSTTDHTAQGVPLTAVGPGAARLSGPRLNTEIYDAMRWAIDWHHWLPVVSRR